MTSRQWIRAAQFGFLAAGVLALGYCVAVLLDARVFQARTGRNFAAELRRNELRPPPAPGSSAILPVPEDGGVVGRLEIPRVGVSVMVVEGVNDGDLKRAAGHIPGTAFPCQRGNVGIAGHRDTFFRPLRSIRPSDTITLTTLQGTFHYQVASTKVVRPDDVQVLYPAGRDLLTLVTCYPFDYIGPAPKRFIVRAVRLPEA